MVGLALEAQVVGGGGWEKVWGLLGIVTGGIGFWGTVTGGIGFRLADGEGDGWKEGVSDSREAEGCHGEGVED